MSWDGVLPGNVDHEPSTGFNLPGAQTIGTPFRAEPVLTGFDPTAAKPQMVRCAMGTLAPSGKSPSTTVQSGARPTIEHGKKPHYSQTT